MASPHGDKHARKVYELQYHRRYFDIHLSPFLSSNGQSTEFMREVLLSVRMPYQVNYFVRFFSYLKPVKNAVIRKQYPKIWRSKYFKHKWDLPRRHKTISELLDEKYDKDREIRWPSSFHSLTKYNSRILRQMLKVTQRNYDERIYDDSLGIQPDHAGFDYSVMFNNNRTKHMPAEVPDPSQKL